MLQDPASRSNGEWLLARADDLLATSRAVGLADGSDLLPSGLTRRLASLASALRAAVASAAAPGQANLDLPPDSRECPGQRRAGVDEGGQPPAGRGRPAYGPRSTPRYAWPAGWRSGLPELAGRRWRSLLDRQDWQRCLGGLGRQRCLSGRQ